MSYQYRERNYWAERNTQAIFVRQNKTKKQCWLNTPCRYDTGLHCTKLYNLCDKHGQTYGSGNDHAFFPHAAIYIDAVFQGQVFGTKLDP